MYTYNPADEQTFKLSLSSGKYNKSNKSKTFRVFPTLLCIPLLIVTRASTKANVLFK